MSDNFEESSLSEGENQSEVLDRWEERHRRREERRAARGLRTGNAWLGGAILIVLGLVFLFQNLGTFELENWWALFILIPAVGAYGAAWRSYQDSGGSLTSAARGSLFTGFVLTMVAAIFLFNLNWTILGPVLIILVGVGLLVNTILPR